MDSTPKSNVPGERERVSSVEFWRKLRPEDADLDPRRIGPYAIEKVLGAGSYGIVYLAHQEHPRRAVALKILRSGVASTEAIQRFELEAHALARLQHPGIAQVFEAGQADFGFGPQPYCAMEYVRGRPIDAYAREVSLALRDQVKLVIRLCDAVQHAHQKGVVHRDLSPSNVLVDEDGRPKIVDFGLARLSWSEASPVSFRTQPGQVLGTLPYASPEQVGGRSEDVDTRTDVYSLGALAYELFTGGPPCDLRGLSLAEAARVIQEEQPVRAGKLVPALTGDLETILAQALAKERERRYASAAELGADLGRWLRDEPISARRASALYQLGKLARRHRGLAVGTLSALLSLALGLAGTLAGLVRAQRAEADLTRRAASAEQELAFLMEYALGTLVPKIGATELQRPLLEELRARIEGRLAEDPADARLRADLARTLEALGSLEAGLDHDERALELQMRALGLREALVGELPGELAPRRALSVSLVKVGDLARKRGDLEEALGWYLSALERDERLAAEEPSNARVLDDLCWSYERVGVLRAALGERDAARALFVKRHAIAEELTGWDPEPRKARFNLCASHERLGALATEESNWAEAVRHAREQVRLARALAAEAPEDRHYARYLAGAYGMAARAEILAGNRAAAEPLLRGSASTIRYLAEVQPEDGELLEAAAHYHADALAGFLIEEGHREEALAVLRELHDLGLRLGTRAPGAIGPLRVERQALSLLAKTAAEGDAAAFEAEERRLHTAIGLHRSANADDHFRCARFLLEVGGEGDAELAIQAAERACAASTPPQAGARLLLSRALLAGGRPADALAALEGGEDLRDGNARDIAELRRACRDALAESPADVAHGSGARVLDGADGQ